MKSQMKCTSNIVALCLVVLLQAFLCRATIGADWSTQGGESIGLSQIQCLVSHGYSFAIIETWQGGLGWNTNIVNNANDAWQAGMAHVDVYVFMCPNCQGNGDPVGTISGIVDGLHSKGVKYGMLWFDVEQCSGCWSDASTNANYLARAVNQAISMGVHVGVYSSEYEWGATVGGYTGFSHLAEWYAHWDGVPSFSDGAYRYGGWTSPSIKQYIDSGACFSVDSDWYPSSEFDSWRHNITSTAQKPVDMEDLHAFFANKKSGGNKQ